MKQLVKSRRIHFKQKEVVYKLILFLSLIMVSLSSYGQGKVTGKVLDENGLPLAGASVSVKGTTISTVTDIEGNYEINVPMNKAEITVKYKNRFDKAYPIDFSESTEIKFEDAIMVKNETSKSITGIQFGLGTNIYNEFQIANSLYMHSQVDVGLVPVFYHYQGMVNGGSGMVSYVDKYAMINTAANASVEMRLYLNHKRRSRKGKSIRYCAGTYWGLGGKYCPSFVNDFISPLVSDEQVNPVERSSIMLLTTCLGVRSTIGKRGNFEMQLGVGTNTSLFETLLYDSQGETYELTHYPFEAYAAYLKIRLGIDFLTF